jgi:hypothetical protein
MMCVEEDEEARRHLAPAFTCQGCFITHTCTQFMHIDNFLLEQSIDGEQELCWYKITNTD